MTRLTILLSLSLAGGITACSLDHLPFAYRMDVHQGSIIEQAAIDQLRTGMTRKQVQFLLGSPAINDTFHANRWDYIQALKPGRKPMTVKRLSVFFDDDELIAIEGDFPVKDPTLKRQG
jgi:outer membrane protein assembly factor BamE